MSTLGSTGEYLDLVVRVQVGDAGCSLVIEDDETHHQVSLTPALFVIRLWRSGGAATLRGSIGLHGTDLQAPIHTTTALEQIVRTWLLNDRASIQSDPPSM